MPSSLLSHQGAVLPLKVKYPERFDGTALCTGSFTPDLGLVISYFYGDHADSVFHSVGGFIYTIPISLLLVILLKKALFPMLFELARERQATLLSRWMGSLGFHQKYSKNKENFSLRWLVKATYSVLAGILSHFLLDLPTHRWTPYLSPFYNGEMPGWFLHRYGELNLPFYGTLGLTNYNLLWILFSIGFGILALHNICQIRKNQLLIKWHRT